MAVLKSGRKRVRLPAGLRPEVTAALEAGKLRAQAAAPRKGNGKMMTNYRYRRLLDNPEYELTEDGVPIGPVARTFGGPPSEHKDPIIIRDPLMAKRIVKGIANGYPYTTVCSFVGIRINQFLSWMEKGKNGHNPELAEFYRQVCKAEATGEMNILKRLRRHSSSDWRVSAWQLERIWPEKYGRVDRIRAETRATVSVTTDTKKNLGTKVLQDDIARELARRMIDGDAQLHFNTLPAPKGTGNGHA